MTDDQAYPLDALASCGLPSAWAKQDAWTVLDTDFQNGSHFLGTWLAWQRDLRRPRILHYVGVAPLGHLLAQSTDAVAHGDKPKGWQAFAAQCTNLYAGFHRILLDGGQVSLTLCIGDIMTVLGEHVFRADTVFGNAPEDKWAAQMLARRCKRGTRLHIHRALKPDSQLRAWMLAAGFQLDDSPDQTAGLTGSFNPRWDIPTGRTLTPYVVQCPARCAVVGAGIAGASVAHALALRGWDVTVFDTAHTPAGGASGLPAGLAVPHVSLDDNPRARLSRSGCSLLGQHAQHLLERGQDWNPGGVEERRADRGSLWHPQACWIKPSKLVEGWLSHAGVRFVGGHTVASLHHTGGGWQLQGPQGQDLGQFEVAVVANAMGCAALLESLPTDTPLGLDVQDKLAALQAVHGTLSFGPTPLAIASLPATPVNGNGCFIPQVPSAVGHQWFVGSTFETDATLAADGAAQHSANMRRLEKLSPMEGIDLAEVLELGPVSQWSGTRCVTHDRMPLVGPIDTGASTGLWLCIGMGSRGLSLSAVCAELLAARLGGEPLPVEFSLSRSLDVNRLRRRSTGKSPT